MARLIPLWTGETVSSGPEVYVWLRPHGVEYAVWEIGDAVKEVAARPRLEDAEKRWLIEQFGDHLTRLAQDKGYVDSDVVAIRPDLPGVDEALARFDRVHYHDDDEVRAIVGGRGVFGFVGDDGRQFLLEVEAGDYISVPAGMWHWFYCREDRNITAIRLFKDTAGWVPHYRSTERGPAGV